MDGPNLLVVDDDRSNCAIVSQKLAGLGYRIDEAFDGASALKLLSRVNYVLAVLDYQMPGMNGVELFQEMVARQPHIRAVFLTSFLKFKALHPGISDSGTRVLTKPVDFDQLIPLVEALVGKPSASGPFPDPA